MGIVKSIFKLLLYSVLAVVSLLAAIIGYNYIATESNKIELVCSGTGTLSTADGYENDSTEFTVVLDPRNGRAYVTGGPGEGLYYSEDLLDLGYVQEFNVLPEDYLVQKIVYFANGNPKFQWMFTLDRRTLSFDVWLEDMIETEHHLKGDYAGSCRKQSIKI